MSDSTTRLWDKGQPLDERILRYTAGEDHVLDARLLPYDVQASIAHARMLQQQGLLSAADADSIEQGLNALAASHAAGEWQITLQDEDVHTALEGRLTAAIGEAGKRIHLGRSRNDQVLVAMRLYLRDATTQLAAAATSTVAALEGLAKTQGDIAMPGYTHMQQGMPSSVALWANAYVTELNDDIAGIQRSLKRINLSPLGSAAGYGTPNIPVDRQATADALGFDKVHEPVTAVQLSRGKAEAGLVFELCLLMQDLGRLASDLLLFYTQEFAFVSLPGNMTTGSSIMPQKRNPDVLELVRAATATMQASLFEIMGITSKLPSGYQRDLQRLKPPLFKAVDLAEDSALIMASLLGGLKFLPENIHLDPSVHAAGDANKLVVEEGISFRDAYRRVGEVYKK